MCCNALIYFASVKIHHFHQVVGEGLQYALQKIKKD